MKNKLAHFIYVLKTKSNKAIVSQKPSFVPYFAQFSTKVKASKLASTALKTGYLLALEKTVDFFYKFTLPLNPIKAA